MTEQGCQADDLFLNAYVVFHTGLVLTMPNLSEQVDNTQSLTKAMNECQSEVEWINIIQRYRSDLLYSDMYSPPKMDCLIETGKRIAWFLFVPVINFMF